MQAIRYRVSGNLCGLVLAVAGVGACSDPADTGSPSNGNGAGGSSAGSSAAGATTAGGMVTSGGMVATAGKANDGGSPSQAGAGTGGAGGSSSAGTAGSGNGGSSAGQAGGGGASGSGAGGAAACTKGQTKGSEVAVIGESFIALSHGITQQIEKRAKENGSLAQNESYVDNSVSGTTLANDQIPSQYTKAASNGTIKYVLMDGGGNDCLINNDGDAALAAAESLFETMAEKKTEKVLYFFYPDPIGNQYASLKSCLDTLRPKMKALCDELTAPKCYWLDLRPVWNGHNEYTGDGIHPTAAGSTATGDAVWAAMVEHCVAQ
jgi:hypothetical protein